jgi:cell division protein FtsL
MTEKNKNIGKNKNLFIRWMGYDWIVKNLIFFLFLALLAVIYIANGHKADNTIRDISNTAKEVKELQYEYKSLKSEEMFKSREAQIVQAATPLGLKISNDQPMRLTVGNKPDNNGR